MKKFHSTTFRVMIIAQSATTIATICHVLGNSGATTQVVSNFFDAILCSNSQRFDLVLCDCDLADPMLAEALARCP
jgi:CheY-like chemotaxis protein